MSLIINTRPQRYRPPDNFSSFSLSSIRTCLLFLYIYNNISNSRTDIGFAFVENNGQNYIILYIFALKGDYGES